MADPHKLRRGARILITEPDGSTVRGTFQGIVPPNPSGRVRERTERLVVRWDSVVIYVPFIRGTAVKLLRGEG